MLLRLPALFLLVACSDYDVSRSELSAEAESREMTLTAGGTTEVTLRMEADAEALLPKPTSYVDITIFALREELVPVVTASAASETIEQQVVNIEYLELVVNDPMRNCIDPDSGGPEATLLENGNCIVLLPVEIGVADGTVSLQVTAHYELSFGSRNAPGTMGISVAE